MSRIGKLPVNVPGGVDVTIDESEITVKGPKGSLCQPLTREIKVAMADNTISVTPANESKKARAQWGLYRVLINNMVTGVTNGFTKELAIIGVGFRAEMRGKDLMIHVGYSHPIMFRPPEGITFGIDGPTKILVSGIDKQAVGQVASDVRSIRPPEPYKGKGIRYAGEEIRRKAGKAGTK